MDIVGEKGKVVSRLMCDADQVEKLDLETKEKLLTHAFTAAMEQMDVWEVDRKLEDLGLQEKPKPPVEIPVQ